MIRMVLSVLVAGMVTIAPAWSAPLTDKQGDAILQELRQIRQLLEKQQQAPVRPAVQAQPAPDPMVKVGVRDIPALGRADAPLVMVMFTDYECPFCRRFETQTLPEIRKQFVDSGKLKIVIKDLPLEFHAHAHRAAEAAHCAAEQGRYWAFRDGIAQATEPLESPRLAAYAKSAGLEEARFNDCVASKRFANAVDASLAEAVRLGISGTPTFVVGTEKDGEVEGVRLVGALPYGAFEQKLKELAVVAKK